MPKSSTFTRPSVVRSRLSGLMSRWMIPVACAAASTSSTSSATRSTVAASSGSLLRRAIAESVSPSSSSITRKGAPSSVVSMSRISTAPGCRKRFARRASCSKRARSSGDEATIECMILIASRRPILCRATYTLAIPPSPRSLSSVHLPRSVEPMRSEGEPGSPVDTRASMPGAAGWVNAGRSIVVGPNDRARSSNDVVPPLTRAAPTLPLPRLRGRAPDALLLLIQCVSAPAP